MPAKMNMIISNGNIMPPQIRSIQTPTLKVVAPKPSAALNSSIITRIQGVKSGCGSCGR